MALTASKVKLPTSVAVEIVNKARDTSTIATLSPSSPQLFTNSEYMLFNGNAEAEVLAEGDKKGSHEYSTTNVAAKTFKVQTTTRVTSELQWADEDNQLQIISQIQEDQARAMGRALDYVVYHAINPKTGNPLSGYEALSATAKKVTASGDYVADIDALCDALNDVYDINGFALSKTLAGALRKVRVPSTGMRMYPEIPMNLNVGSIEGISAATSGTVSGRLATTQTNVLAFMGDFSLIKWGMVRDLTAEIIEYGDPDGTGVDLKAYNQIAYRTEAVYAYAVIDPEGLAVLKGAASGMSAAKASKASAKKAAAETAEGAE